VNGDGTQDTMERLRADVAELAAALRDAEDKLRYYRQCMPDLVDLPVMGYAATEEAREVDAALARAVAALQRVGVEPINGP